MSYDSFFAGGGVDRDHPAEDEVREDAEFDSGYRRCSSGDSHFFRLLMVSSYSVALLLIKRSSTLIANKLSNITARYIDKRNDSVDVQRCQVGFGIFIGYSTFTYRMMHWSNSS